MKNRTKYHGICNDFKLKCDHEDVLIGNIPSKVFELILMHKTNVSTKLQSQFSYFDQTMIHCVVVVKVQVNWYLFDSKISFNKNKGEVSIASHSKQ